MKKTLLSLCFFLSVGVIAMDPVVQSPEDRLIGAAKAGRVDLVITLIDDFGVSVDTQDELGNTALHFASNNELFRAALLERGAQIVQNNEGNYPQGLEPSLYSRATSYLGPSAALLYKGGSYVGAGTYQLGAKAFEVTACAAQHYATALRLRSAIMKPGPLSQKTALVEPTIKAVSSDEEDIVALRAKKAQAAINKLLGRETTYTPRVGLCFGGGGARAMLTTVGWLDAAQQIGLLDTAVYMAGLSGSTWAINPLLASGMSIDEYKAQLSQRLIEPLVDQVKNMTAKEIQDILRVLGRKYYNNQQLGPVDVYGALLAHLFLRNLPGIDNPYEYTFSQLQENVRTANYPFPLSTAVLGIHETEEGQFKYRPTFEVSPFTTGSHELETFVPTAAVGRAFKDGESLVTKTRDIFALERYLTGAALATLLSVTVSPFVAPLAIPAVQRLRFPQGTEKYYGHELPLGYFMGVFGSAFSVDMYRVLLELQNKFLPQALCPKDVKTSQNVLSVLQSMLSTIVGGTVKYIPGVDATAVEESLKNDDQYAAARIPNFSYAIRHKDLNHLEEITLVDGGFLLVDQEGLNIGIVPLLQRNLDVIYISDSSRNLKGAPSLRAAERLAKELNLPFPRIADELWDDIDSRLATLIVDPDNQDAPIIVYMPSIANPSFGDLDPQTAAFTDTTNFTYTEEQATSLMNLMGQNVLDSREILVEAVKQAVARKEVEKEEVEEEKVEPSYLSTIWGYIVQAD